MENVEKQPEQLVFGVPRSLVERAVNLTAAVALTAVVLKYTTPLISDLIYTRDL